MRIGLNHLLATILVAAGWSAWASADQPPATQPTNSTTYSDPQYKFSLTYSADWKAPKESNPALRVVLYWTPPGQEEHKGIVATSLQVQVVEGADAKDLDAVARAYCQGVLKKYPGARVGSILPTKLGEESALQVTCAYTAARMKLKILHIFSVHDGKLYLLAVLADPDNYQTAWAAAQPVVESFHWNK